MACRHGTEAVALKKKRLISNHDPHNASRQSRDYAYAKTHNLELHLIVCVLMSSIEAVRRNAAVAAVYRRDAMTLKWGVRASSDVRSRPTTFEDDDNEDDADDENARQRSMTTTTSGAQKTTSSSNVCRRQHLATTQNTRANDLHDPRAPSPLCLSASSSVCSSVRCSSTRAMRLRQRTATRATSTVTAAMTATVKRANERARRGMRHRLVPRATHEHHLAAALCSLKSVDACQDLITLTVCTCATDSVSLNESIVLFATLRVCMICHI